MQKQIHFMSELDQIKKVKAPEGCGEYLTPGKEYDVLNLRRSGPSLFFEIYDDLQSLMSCQLKNCHHLNGLNWITGPGRPSIGGKRKKFISVGIEEHAIEILGEDFIKKDANETYKQKAYEKRKKE